MKNGGGVSMLDGIKAMSEKLEGMLRLRTPIIGVKLVYSIEEMPGPAYSSKATTVCQLTGLARYHDLVVRGDKDTITCPMGAAALGFSGWPPGFFETRVGEYSDDINAIERMMLSTPQIEPGTFSGVMAAPIAKMTVVPDVVSIYANTAQVLLLAYGVSWKAGDQLECVTTGHMGECSNTIAATYLEKRPCLALPCYGARRRGLCTDSEMIVGLPPEKLEEVVEGVLRTCERGRAYPIKVHGLIGHYSAHWPGVTDKLY
jgi:uncharacterized protein (DUF169 family)